MRKFFYHNEFTLESGQSLNGLEIAYHTYGNLHPSGGNVVWVFHALTANSDVIDWWPDIVGKGCVFDPTDYFIVCANVLGGCYGSSGPASVNPGDGTIYGHNFPAVTIRDIVKAHDLLRCHLGIQKIAVGLGGSMGGMQLLEWAVSCPSLFGQVVLIATSAKSSPWIIALNETQRMAIEVDPSWLTDSMGAGKDGLMTARAIALLSYRNYSTYNNSQRESNDHVFDEFRAASYQRYQGEKLAKRFNAISYYRLTHAMDSHNLGRNRVNAALALNQVTARVLVIGITSDLLFPLADQMFIARHISNVQYVEMYSEYGHDGFLIESKKLSDLIRSFVQTQLQFEEKGETVLD